MTPPVRPLFAAFCWLLAAGPPPPALGATLLHHDIEAWVVPKSGTIRVVDRVTLPAPSDSFEFFLHAKLEVSLATPNATLVPLGRRSGRVPLEGYRVDASTPLTTVELAYEGRIAHGVNTRASEYAGGRESTPGLVSTEGVFLGGSSAWYPWVPGERVGFSLRVHLPTGWSAVSQGARTAEGTWSERHPQDEIYLIAAPYRVYERQTPVALAQVYLLQGDDALAERYLLATERYLDLFSRLVGTYPYAKFALVENSWQSGYGMPSFTLLGSRVIRLPFIADSSYPHEILHNWWGNGVYVDYGTGNWAEGLTAYLADHLLKEQAGGGAAYRRDTLQSYLDYVDRERDFPLTDFRGHHGQVSQAVGYGKTAMLFHMLRGRLGDETFLRGLRRFFEENRFGTAGFEDLRSAFESVSGQDLAPFFRQWTTRPGAPELALGEPVQAGDGAGHPLRIRLEQVQPEEPFTLDVPLFVQLEGEALARRHTVTMTGRESVVDLDFDRRPLRVMVDPRFDLFRRLDPSEVPPSLGRLFGAERVTLLLPSSARPPMRQAYQALAERWATRGEGISWRWDDEPGEVPDGPVWLFGAENRRLGELGHLPGTEASANAEGLELQGENYPFERTSFGIALADPEGGGRPLGWLHIHSPAAAEGLARKIVHYRKYSYALFAGDAPDNLRRGQWPVSSSRLSRTLAPGAPPPALPEAPALARLATE